jgi:hypothetical protein
MINQAGLGNALTAAGLQRLARPHVRAAVAAAERAGDPVAVVWTYILACLHWLAVGDWAAVDAGLPRALEAATRARLHRMVDQVVLLAAVGRYLTGRFGEAAAMSEDARAAARDRHDPMAQLWGLVVLAEARLRTDPADPALADALEEGRRCRPPGSRRSTPSASTWPRPAISSPPGARTAPGARSGPPPAWPAPTPPSTPTPSRPTPASPRSAWPCWRAAGRRARRWPSCGRRRPPACAGWSATPASFPMACPRARLCQGAWQALEGRRRAALRSWARAVEAAERLAMPWELAWGQLQLGRHLGLGERASDGLDGATLLDRAAAGFEAMGCRPGAEPGRDLAGRGPQDASRTGGG